MAIPRFEPEPCPFIGQPCEYVPMAHRMLRLEKEIERLRVALKDIIDNSDPTYTYARLRAAAALKETE